jgi:hypothetical protein
MRKLLVIVIAALVLAPAAYACIYQAALIVA